MAPVFLSQEGISFEDVQAFTELVENISDVEMALSMYMAAGASITPGNNRAVYTPSLLPPSLMFVPSPSCRCQTLLFQQESCAKFRNVTKYRAKQ